MNVHRILVPFIIDIIVYYASQQINYNISLSRKLLECQYEKLP